MNRWSKLMTCALAFASLAGCESSRVPPDVIPDLVAAAEIRGNLVDGSEPSESADPVDLPDPTGFATLVGKITLQGAAPPNPNLSITKDQAVCMPDGSPVKDEIVITGPGGGLANVLIYADAVPDEWCHESMIGNTDTVEFDQKKCLFLSRIFPMQTSQTLKILNSDPVGHNADIKPARNRPMNLNIGAGGSQLYQPSDGELKEEKSPFTVSCSAHAWMKSYMIFRKNGYFAVTGEDGSFEIPNLPAGVDLKLIVWHEATRFVPASSVTTDESIARDWNKRGAFTVNLEPDSRTELSVAIDSSIFTN